MVKKVLLKYLSQRRALFRFISALALFKVGINTSLAQSDFYIPGSLINLSSISALILSLILAA